MLSISIAIVAYGLSAEARADSANHTSIGGGVAVLPEFQGSDDYRVMPIPLIDVRRGRFFAQMGDGIGVDLISMSGLRAGVSVTWIRGYGSDDVPQGIGKTGSTMGGRAFVSGQVGGVMMTVSAIAPVGGDMEGVILNAGASYPVQVGRRLTVSPSVGTNWADARYMRRYFGVNAEQAAASGLTPYRPSGGFTDVNARLAANYRLTDHISVVGIVLISHNLDRVTDTPYIDRRWQPAGVLGLTYTF